MKKIDGNKIKKIREAKGLTQLYVATVVGVTTDTVSRWENQRYQTVKTENAVKLAEALETPLTEILQENGQGEDETVGEAVATKHIFPLPRLVLLAAIVVIVGGAAILWLAVPHAPVPKTEALRVLPGHFQPGAPFPVSIVVHTMQTSPAPLIVEEKVPAGINAIKGVPPFHSFDRETGVIKWISTAASGQLRFSYLAVISDANSKATGASFSGRLIFRGHERATNEIAGPSSIQPAPFHWADSNEDNHIDDEEILAVFEQFNDLQGFDALRDQIEDIWAADGYRWDAKHGDYKILH